VFRIWLAFALIVASQNTFEATGELDWVSPVTGTMYPGEWTVFALALGVVALFLWSGFERGPRQDIAGAVAFSACVAGFLASFEPVRHVRPLVCGWTVLAITGPAAVWAESFPPGLLRRMALVVAVFQGMCALLYVYAQSRIGIVPVPASALYYLHGPLADYLPTLIGTAALAAATLWKRG
jgi:hypothetical protein